MQVIRKKGMDFMTINYRYDGVGNRVMKLIEKRMSGTIEFTTTHYVRDATGNIMATYKNSQVQELHLYGSSRLGTYKIPYEPDPNDNTKQIQKDDFHKLILGRRYYELTNHLGNVLAVISDKKILNGTSFEADVVATNDYYPFGMTIQSRTFASEEYRFGFNGKENDTDFGEGIQDYGARIYDERNARFLSTDPLMAEFLWSTPYSFAANNPIFLIDKNGENAEEPNQEQSAMSLSEYIEQLKNLKVQTLSAFNRVHPDQVQKMYLYSKKWGWLDMKHFSRSAEATDYPFFTGHGVLGLGETYEVAQQLEIADVTSAWDYEDLTSNLIGVYFETYLESDEAKGKDFLTNLENYLRELGFDTNPTTDAPNWQQMPADMHTESELPTKRNYDPSHTTEERTSDLDKKILST